MDQLRSDHNDKKSVPVTILENAYEQAISAAGASFVKDATIQDRIALVARGKGNKSCVRALLACALAKIDRPEIDIRKPYTKIKARNSYSGRDYDERYVQPFVSKHNLPVNSTTAFLTPAFRNRNITLTPKIDLVGRPPEIYKSFLALLDDVHQGRISAEQLLVETVRNLILEGNKNASRLTELLAAIQRTIPRNELAAEAILLLVEHHLSMGSSSRLPVLIVAAAYTLEFRLKQAIDFAAYRLWQTIGLCQTLLCLPQGTLTN